MSIQGDAGAPRKESMSEKYIQMLSGKFRENHVTKPGRVIPKSLPAKQAAWLLSKTNHEVVVDHRYDTVEYSQISIESFRDVLKAILDHKAMRAIWNKEIDRVVVGRDIFYDMLDYKLEHSFSARVPLELGFRGKHFIFGVRVQCIPWMEGFVVLPKEEFIN